MEVKGFEAVKANPFGGAGGEQGSRRAYIEASYPRRIALAIDSTEYSPAQRQVMSLIVGQRRSGIVIGGNGTGKTLLLSRCQVDLLEEGVQAKILDAPEMFERLRGVIDRHESVESYIRDKWAGIPCLFIDEADKAYGSQMEFLNFARLVNLRWEGMLQTVVFGNFPTWEDCIGRLGQSAFDRLADVRDGFRAVLKGGSYRQGRGGDGLEG